MLSKTLKAISGDVLQIGLLCALAGAPNVYAEAPAGARASNPAFDQHVSFDQRGCDGSLFGERFLRTELFFGLSKPKGSIVTDKEFQRFVSRKVTPRFPDGLMLLAGYGQFRDPGGRVVREPSRLLILLYPLSDEKAHERIEEIRKAYKQDFRQESVLRADSQSCVSF